MPGMAPMRDSIRTVEGRQKTFVNWPHKGFVSLTPLQLAQAGFFYTPSPEFEDRVTLVPSRFECMLFVQDSIRDDISSTAIFIVPHTQLWVLLTERAYNIIHRFMSFLTKLVLLRRACGGLVKPKSFQPHGQLKRSYTQTTCLSWFFILVPSQNLLRHLHAHLCKHSYLLLVQIETPYSTNGVNTNYIHELMHNIRPNASTYLKLHNPSV